jgi:hypothetical protein
MNPWNHPVRIHTYTEYEDEYRKPMIKAGIPVDTDITAGSSDGR